MHSRHLPSNIPIVFHTQMDRELERTARCTSPRGARRRGALCARPCPRCPSCTRTCGPGRIPCGRPPNPRCRDTRSRARWYGTPRGSVLNIAKREQGKPKNEIQCLPDKNVQGLLDITEPAQLLLLFQLALSAQPDLCRRSRRAHYAAAVLRRRFLDLGQRPEREAEGLLGID